MRHDYRQVYVQRSMAWDGWSLTLVSRFENTRTTKVAQVTWVDHAPGDHAPPTTHLEEAELQHLMEQLWAAGFRPKNVDVGGAAHVGAMKEHLADLRQLVFRPDPLAGKSIDSGRTIVRPA